MVYRPFGFWFLESSPCSVERRVIVEVSQATDRERSLPDRVGWSARGCVDESPGRWRVKAHQRDGPASCSSWYEDWYEATSDGRFSEVRASEYLSLADGGASSVGDGGSSRAQADAQRPQ